MHGMCINSSYLSLSKLLVIFTKFITEIQYSILKIQHCQERVTIPNMISGLYMPYQKLNHPKNLSRLCVQERDRR